MHAGRGLIYTFRNERNFQVEVAIASLIVFLILWLPLSPLEQVAIVLTVTLVLALELINTAIERIIDILKPRIHPYARVVKDMMAGAVAVVALGACIVGAIIFLPYIFK